MNPIDATDRQALNARDELRAAEEALSECRYQTDEGPAVVACWRLAQAVIARPNVVEGIQGRNYRYVLDESVNTLEMLHLTRRRGTIQYWILREPVQEKPAAPVEILREFVRDAGDWLASDETRSIGQARQAAFFKLADYRCGRASYEEFAAAIFALADRLCAILREADDQFVIYDRYANFRYDAREQALVMTWVPSGESWIFVASEIKIPDEKLAWLVDAAKNYNPPR